MKRKWDLLWLILLAIYIIGGVSAVPFHGDESTLIYMGRDSYYQIQGNLELVTYSANPVSETDQQLRLLNGTVSKYLYGLTAYLSGYSLEEINGQWDWGADWHYNVTTGRLPDDTLLMRSRIVSATLTVIAVIALLAVADKIGGRMTAYFTTLYFVLNPSILINGRRAIMEGAMLLGAVIVVLAAVWLLERFSLRRLMVLGIAAGIAFAGKHTNAFAIVALFLGLTTIYTYDAFTNPQRGKLLKRWFGLAAAGVFAFVVFLLLNPAWWGNPLDRIGTVLEARVGLLSLQVYYDGGYSGTLDQLAGFLRQTFVATPQFYEVSNWANFIPDQIAAYNDSLWRGITIGGSLIGAIIWAVIVLIGAWRLIADKEIKPYTRFLTATWAVIVILTTLLLTPLEWQRYYLPAFPVIALLGGLSLSYIVKHIKTRLSR